MPNPKKLPPKKGKRPKNSSLMQQRVEHIAQLMATFQYVPRITCTNLSKEWGLSYKTVEVYAGMASILIRSAVAKGSELRAQVTAGLATIAALAVKEKQYRVAVEAARVLVGISELDRGPEDAEGLSRFVVELVPPVKPEKKEEPS